MLQSCVVILEVQHVYMLLPSYPIPAADNYSLWVLECRTAVALPKHDRCT